jgi:hypothetical protein
MRHRIGALIYDFRKLHEELGVEIQQRMGINVDHYVRWTSFLKEIALRDVLDLITVAYGLLAKSQFGGSVEARNWRLAIQQIFKEENVSYRIDDQGGVHFHIDQEFARNSATTIACLQSARYANARHAFEGGQTSLSKTPPDGKGAIRGTFGALEAVFRLMFPAAPRLTAKEADQQLRPLLRQAHAGDAAASGAANKLLTSFKEWIDAAHFYRHEQGVPDKVVQPPLQFAIYMVSSGAAHLRWLAELDTERGLSARNV